MARWLFHIFTFVSLLLMLICCIGRASPIDATHRSGGRIAELRVERHHVTWATMTAYDDSFWSRPSGWHVAWADDAYSQDVYDYLKRIDGGGAIDGQVLAASRLRTGDHALFARGFALRVSIYLLIPLLGALPLIWVVKYRARRREKFRRGRGLCPVCRYDQRANTADKCPECGTSRAAG